MRKSTRSKEQWEEAIGNSSSVAQALEALGLFVGGGNYKSFYFNARKFGIDFSHFTGQLWSKDKVIGPKRPLSDYLTKDSNSIQSHKLKLRLIREGIKTHECESCKLSEWQNRPIPLELEHVNGVNNDNRLENLKILCPNCHAQTETYRGKNKGKRFAAVA